MFNILLTIAILAGPGYHQTGAHVLPRKVNGLTPFQAVCKISKIIDSDRNIVAPHPKPIPKAMREKIAIVISQIAWPRLTAKRPWIPQKPLTGLANEIKNYRPKIDKKYNQGDYYFRFTFSGALSLVLAAWDKELLRPQFTDPFVRSCDSSTHFLHGTTYQSDPHSGAASIARNWPWILDNGRWHLKKAIIVIFISEGDGSIYGSTYSYLETWNDVDRIPKKSK